MDIAKMNNSVTTINTLGFTEIWSGAAYDVQSDSLNDAMSKLNKAIEDISTFDQALTKKEEYIEICEQISGYHTAIAYCDPETDEGEAAISYYRSQINALEIKRTSLRVEIIALLSKFEGIDIELSPPVIFETPVLEDGEKIDMPDDLPSYDPLAITNPSYNGVMLTPSMGRNDNGPQGCETWYDLDMSYVVERMDTVYGIPIETWVDPNTGVKMCKKVGEDTAYVMVAADAESVWGEKDYNPESTYHMGDIVLTSWGPGMVVDYCGLAVDKREQGRENHFDIATAWGTGQYIQAGQEYADAANARLKEGEE